MKRTKSLNSIMEVVLCMMNTNKMRTMRLKMIEHPLLCMVEVLVMKTRKLIKRVVERKVLV